MKIPEYVSKAEVKRVCQEIGLMDWTTLTEPAISLKEAKIVQAEVGGEAMFITPEDFKHGLEVELEHGIQFPDANVTNNHPILTGRIVLAHLKEMLDYYLRLEVAELEGDLLKAAKTNSEVKMLNLYKRLLKAKLSLSQNEAGQH